MSTELHIFAKDNQDLYTQFKVTLNLNKAVTKQFHDIVNGGNAVIVEIDSEDDTPRRIPSIAKFQNDIKTDVNGVFQQSSQILTDNRQIKQEIEQTKTDIESIKSDINRNLQDSQNIANEVKENAKNFNSTYWGPLVLPPQSSPKLTAEQKKLINAGDLYLDISDDQNGNKKNQFKVLIDNNGNLEWIAVVSGGEYCCFGIC